jgi:DNA repair exonuclease SbcCD nuclease subunit
MRVAITSDVHLEFGDLDFANDQNADVLILGGDIFIAEDLNYLEPVPINDVIMPSRMALRAQRCYDFVQRCCERFPKVVLIMGNHEHYHGDFAESTWLIRKTFAEGGIDEIISTRRLVHIAKTYTVFNDREKAIQLCVNRFDQETKESFMDLYSKVDVKVAEAAPKYKSLNPKREEDVEIPF